MAAPHVYRSPGPAEAGHYAYPDPAEAGHYIYDSSVAFIVIVALSTRDTGQPALALLAAVSNFALSAPGIFAFTSRCIAVMVNPASVFSRFTVAVVLILSAVMPALPNC